MLEQKAQVVELMRRQSVREEGCPSAFLQVDRRILIIVWFVFAAFTVSVPKFAIDTAVAFAAFPFFVIVACRLPILKMLRRLLIVLPFILLVAAANPFIDTRPVCEMFGLPVNAGMISASVIILKALVSVAAVLTLVELISFNSLCESLLRMGVPEVFTTQLMLVYRYGFLLSDEAQSLGKARELRSFGKRGKGLSTASKMIGSLLVRSVSRSERVYKAMLARGYKGKLIYKESKGLGASDAAFAVTACVIFLMVRIFI
ncbi:MAG TPA: cobalt ECF transporter T component CbiQ [Lentisphaeria bacterium]|nr:MAG: cobalt ECF transporter T component CbiQ [Lentisphaerae bacterium GWF2_49_21]HBC89145.1 cobalt ECF transporter T component CbiQ [Lentisphaeria bacterium]